MNPVVIIATHVRQRITSETIEQLQRQSVVPHIVLVCSLYTEYEYYSEKFDGVTVLVHKNEPLGAKWQFGCYYGAKHFQADPLIILGSDDLLGAGYIENICNEMERQEVDFLGIDQWWILNEKSGIGYRMEYEKKGFPLGGGRAYSQRLLEKLNYTVFDVKKSRLLDDYGWNEAQKSGYKSVVMEGASYAGLNIISIKGDWETMNSAEAILKAKSCKILETFKNGREKINQLL